jgi:hypothetical protein
MAKQIIITEGDTGIVLEIPFIDNNKSAVNLTGYTVETHTVFEDGTSKEDNAQITNAVNGICQIVLDSSYTAVPGLCTIYVSLVDADETVTSQKEVYYYVKEQYGGES